MISRAASKSKSINSVKKQTVNRRKICAAAPMKPTLGTTRIHRCQHLTGIALAGAVLFGASRAPAFLIQKADNDQPLSGNTSWVNPEDAAAVPFAPGPLDVAYWPALGAANRTLPLP